MKDFDRIKSSFLFLCQALFGLTIAAYFHISPAEGPRTFFTVSMLLILTGILILSVPAVRKKAGQHLFLLLTIIIIALIFIVSVYSFPQEAFGDVSQNPYFPLMFIPIIAASVYFSGRESAGTVLIVAMTDIIVSVVGMNQAGYGAEKAFNTGMFFRIISYLIIAIFSRSAFLREKPSDDKEKRIREELEILRTKNYKLREDLKKFRDSSGDESPTLNKYKKDTLLLDFYKTLGKDLDLMTILNYTLRRIKELLGFDTVSIFLFKPNMTELYLAAIDGPNREEMMLNLQSDIGIPYMVAQTGNSMHITDTAQDPRFRIIISRANVGSAFYTPMQIDNLVHGVMVLWHRKKNHCSDDDLNLIKSIARGAAQSINNAELYKKLDTRLNFITTLWEISRNLTSSFELTSSWSAVMEDILKTLLILFHSEKAMFFKFDLESKNLIPNITCNVSEHTKKGFMIHIKRDTFFLSEFLRSNFQVRDLKKDLRFCPLEPFIQEEKISSMLWSPLLGRNRIIGALALFTHEECFWSNEEIQWLEIFSNMLSISLENVMLLSDLLSEKNQLQTLIDNVPEGVFTTDANRLIQSWNRSAEKITGISAGEAIGKDCSRLLKCNGREREFCNKGCPITISLGANKKVESGIDDVFIHGKDENLIPIAYAIAPIPGEEASINGAIMVFRDVTREKEIENMKEEFLATITHDLKSPLASIMGYTEIMLHPKSAPLTDKQKDFLESITRSSKTLQFLIDNILESTRMDAGRLVLNPAVFNLRQLIFEIETMFVPLLQPKNLTLDVLIDNDLEIYMDREKLREVFINLISNAIKFTPKKGSITISSIHNNGKTQIHVCDTGKGIPPSEISNLFNKFTQVKGEQKGTGLGLYICRRILEAHGQNIAVESSVGEGTIFKFTLTPAKV